jgi:hypothetical protein
MTLLGVPLSFRDKSRRKEAFGGWEKAGLFRGNDLTYVFAGLGVLDERHRMRDLAAFPEKHPYFGGIQTPLRQLLKLGDIVHREQSGAIPDYYPLAEICCRFLLVDEWRIPTAQRNRMVRLIKQLDELFLTVPKGILDRIPAMLLVAGGPRKALALREVLSSEMGQFRYVVTDAATAERLLEPSGPASKPPGRSAARTRKHLQ